MTDKASSVLLHLALVLFLCGNSWVAGQMNMLRKPGCNQTEVIKVDRTIARLMPVGPKGRRMPENEAQLKRFCSESRNLTNSAEQFFKKCYSNDLQQTSRLALFPAKKSVQQFCSSNNFAIRKSKRLEKIMKVTPCINKHLQKNDTCLKRFLADLRMITRNVEADPLVNPIPHVCCSAVKIMRCIEVMIDQKKCARANKELILDYMATSAGDFFNVACGDYNDSSDRCQQLKPLDNVTTSSSPAKKQARKSASQMNLITPVFLVIELFSNLGNEPK